MKLQNPPPGRSGLPPVQIQFPLDPHVLCLVPLTHISSVSANRSLASRKTSSEQEFWTEPDSGYLCSGLLLHTDIQSARRKPSWFCWTFTQITKLRQGPAGPHEPRLPPRRSAPIGQSGRSPGVCSRTRPGAPQSLWWIHKLRGLSDPFGSAGSCVRRAC